MSVENLMAQDISRINGKRTDEDHPSLELFQYRSKRVLNLR